MRKTVWHGLEIEQRPNESPECAYRRALKAQLEASMEEDKPLEPVISLPRMRIKGLDYDPTL